MKSIYINLDSASQRRINMENNIKKTALDFIRYPAVDGKKIPNTTSMLNSSQFGCYSSHLQIINYHINYNDHILIIEDDETFDEHINILPNFISEIYSFSWDLIYLDATFVEIYDYLHIARSITNHNFNFNNFSPFLIDLNLNFTIYGTHAYIINKNSINKINDILLHGLSLNKPIDNVFSLAIKNRSLSAKLLVPTLFYPSNDTIFSQISENEHPLMKDWILFRNLISKKNIEIQFKNKVSADFNFENLLNSIIINRLNFSLLGEFSP